MFNGMKIFNSDFDFELFRREEEKARRNYERALAKPNVKTEELESLLLKFETYRQAANLIDYLKWGIIMKQDTCIFNAGVACSDCTCCAMCGWNPEVERERKDDVHSSKNAV